MKFTHDLWIKSKSPLENIALFGLPETFCEGCPLFKPSEHKSELWQGVQWGKCDAAKILFMRILNTQLANKEILLFDEDPDLTNMNNRTLGQIPSNCQWLGNKQSFE